MAQNMHSTLGYTYGNTEITQSPSLHEHKDHVLLYIVLKLD